MVTIKGESEVAQFNANVHRVVKLEIKQTVVNDDTLYTAIQATDDKGVKVEITFFGIERVQPSVAFVQEFS